MSIALGHVYLFRLPAPDVPIPVLLDCSNKSKADTLSFSASMLFICGCRSAHPQNQIGFFKVIALPLISSFCEVFPECTPLLVQVRQRHTILTLL